MNKTIEIVDSIEFKLKILLKKLKVLEQENLNLEQQLNQSKEKISLQIEEIKTLKSNNDTLKYSNALLGSDENKRETKLKINSLIREIDYCITQLSD